MRADEPREWLSTVREPHNVDICSTQVKELKNPGKVYADLMNLLIRLAQYGLIHCDFNEFNLLINDNEEITLIDFPQMVSTSHANADMYD